MKPFNQVQKSSSLSTKETTKIDYKNVQLLQKYISETGKILPRRITLASTKTQRKLAKAIKAARSMALLPYNND